VRNLERDFRPTQSKLVKGLRLSLKLGNGITAAPHLSDAVGRQPGRGKKEKPAWPQDARSFGQNVAVAFPKVLDHPNGPITVEMAVRKLERANVSLADIQIRIVQSCLLHRVFGEIHAGYAITGRRHRFDLVRAPTAAFEHAGPLRQISSGYRDDLVARTHGTRFAHRLPALVPKLRRRLCIEINQTVGLRPVDDFSH